MNEIGGIAYFLRFWFLVLLIGFPTRLEAQIHLQFGLYTSDKPTEMVRKFKAVMVALEESLETKLGEPVKISIQVAKSYEEGVAAIIDGKVDFARLGPASYVAAKAANPELALLAVEKTQEGTVFYGLICVHRDSSIQSVEDLRGKRFAFGDDKSTIGRYLSQQFLINHGIHAKGLSSFDYLGRHDKVASHVVLGSYDAGAIKEGTYRKMLAKGEPLRELARFKNVTKPWVAHQNLPVELRVALAESLVEMTGPEALKALKKTGFTFGSDADYEPIRVAMEVNASFFQ